MDNEEQIRQRAYSLWEQKGRPEGSPDDFWHEARQQIESETPPADEPDSFSGGVESSVAPPMPETNKSG